MLEHTRRNVRFATRGELEGKDDFMYSGQTSREGVVHFGSCWLSTPRPLHLQVHHMPHSDEDDPGRF